MLPFTYHSTHLQTTINFPFLLKFHPFFLQRKVFFTTIPCFSSHLKLHKYALCPFVFPPYLFFPPLPFLTATGRDPSMNCPFQKVLHLSGQTKAFSKPKHVWLVVTISQPLADHLDGHKNW